MRADRALLTPLRRFIWRHPSLARFLPLLGVYRHRREVRKLAASSFEKLNFGCGPHPLDGWTNIDGGDGRRYVPPPHPDIVKLDVFEALARIPAGCARLISSEHFFEHFDRQQGHEILRECLRLLRPGGVVRMVTPDLEKEVKIYLDLLPEIDWDSMVLPHRYGHVGPRNPDPYGKLRDGEAFTRSMLLNNGMHMDGHRYLYDFETISQSMRLAGFTDVRREEFGASRHPELAGIDRHDGGETGRNWVPGIALVVEATKPE